MIGGDKDVFEYVEPAIKDMCTENGYGYMGESGAGKTSFLLAGVVPQLDKSASNYQGIYIRFSNQDPIATIYKALKEELQTPIVAINDRDLLEICISDRGS